ncbi:MAG: pyridoxamine 5'-phosphate oxidase family protein [Pseudomonadales bacterium]
MAQKYPALNQEMTAFIAAQQLYFVGTAADEGRINVSPKGCDTLRVLSDNRIVWLNLTGSGNETAAHLLQNDRITMMFCSFAEKPLILRCYGSASISHPRDESWSELKALFPDFPTARQIVDMRIDLVQTSCGFGVPFYTYEGERDNMSKWASAKGEQGIKDYWAAKNQSSLDGLPTKILD